MSWEKCLEDLSIPLQISNMCNKHIFNFTLGMYKYLDCIHMDNCFSFVQVSLKTMKGLFSSGIVRI